MGDVLQKYLSRSQGERLDPSQGEESESAVDLGAFGWLRGSRERSAMLELRKRTGNILAIDYGGLEIEFDPSEGIILHATSGRKVIIKGQNLNAEIRPDMRLVAGLARHKVPWIQEINRPARMEANEKATVVDAIEW